MRDCLTAGSVYMDSLTSYWGSVSDATYDQLQCFLKHLPLSMKHTPIHNTDSILVRGGPPEFAALTSVAPVAPTFSEVVHGVVD